MRIYVTGPVGSGKSTLARRLSKQYALSYCELDGVVHGPDNRKRTAKERDALFCAAIGQERWIVEDTGHAIFEEALQKADSIILLEPPVSVRRWRIIIRWMKQNLKMEKSGYIADLIMLKHMFKWTKNYQCGVDNLKERLIPYGAKVKVLRSKKDIVRYINAMEGLLCKK